jgi:hypothetical protein
MFQALKKSYTQPDKSQLEHSIPAAGYQRQRDGRWRELAMNSRGPRCERLNLAATVSRMILFYPDSVLAMVACLFQNGAINFTGCVD